MKTLFDKFGGVRPMAEHLGEAPSTVQSWKTAGRIPATRQPIVLAKGIDLGLDVTAEDVVFPMGRPDHDAIDTTGDDAASSGKADNVSAPPDPPFPEPIRRTDDPAPRTPATRQAPDGVAQNHDGAARDRQSCGALPTNSPAPSRTSGGCSTATEIAREVAA